MQCDVGRVGARAIVAGVTAAIVAALVLIGVGTVLTLDPISNRLPFAVSNVTRDVSAALRIDPALEWALGIGASLLVVAVEGFVRWKPRPCASAYSR